MKTRKPVAFGYRPEGATDYRLQVTMWLGDDATDYHAQTLTFPTKKDAMAFAKRAGMAFTS